LAVFSLAQAHTPKIEAQHRKTGTVQRFHDVENDFVVHGAAAKRMRMTNDGGPRRHIAACIQQRLQPPRRPGKE
jgi:hypothetical protein